MSQTTSFPDSAKAISVIVTFQGSACSGYILESHFFVLENYSVVFLRDWLNYLRIAGHRDKMVESPAQSP